MKKYIILSFLLVLFIQKTFIHAHTAPEPADVDKLVQSLQNFHVTGATGLSDLIHLLPKQKTEKLDAYDPLLVVTLMVKNEAHVMQQTLAPFVNGGIDAFLIFDTGSTDSTMLVAKEFFDGRGITKYKILQEPFIDFATSRNHALECAEKLFPQACFMLMPDAEWYLNNAEGLVKFCTEHQQDENDCYLVRIGNQWLDFYTARLMRCRHHVRFVGAIHEVPNRYTEVKVPADIFFEWRTTAYGDEKSRKRYERDCKILQQEYEKKPRDPRTVFYLAQTYACLGDWEKACEWYKKRAELCDVGWSEENFATLCRLAQAYKFLGKNDEAVITYLKAFSFRPSRAEPLIHLAQHYWDMGDKELCFLFVRRAVEIPYPQNDFLFVEKELYEFTRYDLLGRAAWYVGAYELGEYAVRQALKMSPDASYLKNNLAFYTGRKKDTGTSEFDEAMIQALTVY